MDFSIEEVFQKYTFFKENKDVKEIFKYIEDNSMSTTLNYNFENIIVALDFMYDKFIDLKIEKEFLNEFIQTFDGGFNFLEFSISILVYLKTELSLSFSKIEKLAKTYNLYLHLHQFVVSLNDSSVSEKSKDFLDYIDICEKYLLEGQNVDDEIFVQVDNLSNKLFAEAKIEYIPIETAFYDLYIEYKKKLK